MLKLLKRLIGSHAAPADERRRWARFPSHGKAWVHLGPHDADIVSAVIRDISRGGVSLGVDRAVESGTMLRVELPNTTTTVLACVAHVRPMVDETFILGCKFSMELSDADLEALGSRREKPKQADQRAWERVPAAAQGQYTVVDQVGDAKTADVHNLSPAGVALITSEEIIPGTLLNLELRAHRGRQVVRLIACVVYLTSRGEGQWLAGCNFVRELTDEDLQALVAQTP
jgi:hypothetical protein